MKWLSKIDFIAPQINLTYNSSALKRSAFGGSMTILILIFALYCIIYFGRDIIEKKKPITRFSKNYINQTLIKQKDIPLGIFIADQTGTVHTKEFMDYLHFEPMLYEVRFNTETQLINVNLTYFKIEPCNPETDFGKHKNLFTDPNSQIAMADTLCLKQDYSRSMDGKESTELNDFSYMNEMGSSPANFLFFPIYECVPEIAKRKCPTEEQMQKMLNEFYIVLYFPDYYIDLNDNQNPAKSYIFTHSITISRGITKNNYLRFKNTIIETDSGFVMERITGILFTKSKILELRRT